MKDLRVFSSPKGTVCVQDAAFGPAGQQDWKGGEQGVLTLPHFIKKRS